MDYLAKLNKYRVFQYEINSAAQFYHEMVQRTDKFSRLLGANLIRHDFSMINRTFAVMVCLHATYIYLFTTSMYYYRNDIEKILLNITTIGFSIQMLAKIHLYAFRRERIVEINDLNQIYYENKYLDSKTVKDALIKSARLTYVVVKLNFIFSSAYWIVIITGPLTYSIITQNRLLPFGFEWTHSDDWTAYAINFTSQAILVFFVVVATIASDDTFIVYLLTGCGQMDAIVASLQDMNAMIDGDAQERKITEQLTRIIKLHQHLLLYMTELQDKYSGYFLITLGVLSYIMIVSLFAFILINWAMGLVLVLIGTSQLFFVCFLGTYLKMKYDELLLEIWLLKWYKLSIRNQKSYLLFLNGAQVPLSLTAIFTPLDMSAYLSIHKTLYSVCMLMMQFTE
ncbi:odorant receptor 22c-like [Aedes albopictus]|uniref:Odorant receptor n=1 Tax=Aedes albopictus TaxID=7160 RepID=A0ABM1ZB88_AEDAL|nr:odorant receptor 22c-like [Aedes albopictus]